MVRYSSDSPSAADVLQDGSSTRTVQSEHEQGRVNVARPEWERVEGSVGRLRAQCRPNWNATSAAGHRARRNSRLRCCTGSPLPEPRRYSLSLCICTCTQYRKEVTPGGETSLRTATGILDTEHGGGCVERTRQTCKTLSLPSAQILSLRGARTRSPVRVNLKRGWPIGFVSPVKIGHAISSSSLFSGYLIAM